MSEMRDAAMTCLVAGPLVLRFLPSATLLSRRTKAHMVMCHELLAAAMTLIEIKPGWLELESS